MPSLSDQPQRIIKAVHEAVGGQMNVRTDATDVATRVGLSDQDLQKDLSYLEAKGLLVVDWVFGGPLGRKPSLIRLTAEGVVYAIEAS
jgi:predicted ArsR family transcriptional regulator